ncbi:HD domain-containing protein [Brevibacillus sp. SYSU BS000544]|uniref:HD domain-containing protein n=1 Tax=Brevibacillus sp. SYSU BS000544 TaxID=3416443 RepID=UPI003CE51D59
MTEVNRQELSNIIFFIQELERLKENTRTAWTKEGRKESIAEHSWRLTMFALVLEEYFPDLDFGKVLRICLIHDLGEAYDGDISAKLLVDQEKKYQREEETIQQLTEPLIDPTRNKLFALWQEYNQCQTKEAQLVKALDKMETIIQHNQGSNPPDFDYGFNLDYGRSHALFHPMIKAMREMIDQETQRKSEMNQP